MREKQAMYSTIRSKKYGAGNRLFFSLFKNNFNEKILHQNNDRREFGKSRRCRIMNVLKKLTKKVEKSKIVKNSKFLVIGLIAIITVISLVYFIVLKYSPIMNFKYEGYAISGKQITENLLDVYKRQYIYLVKGS